MTLKAVAGLGSIVCLLVGVTLMLKLGSSDAKQSTLTPTEGAVAAMQNVQTAQPTIEAYFVANGTYVGMSVQGLQAAGGAALPAGFQIGWTSASRYCVEDTAGGGTAYMLGPSGVPGLGSCPAA
jgi:hypothetical protein